MTRSTPSAADLATLLSGPAQTVSTTAGRFEYAQAGEGPPALSLHPAVGGWDAGLGMAAPLWANGVRVIAPSRPGYLGTPPQTGPTPLAQADALAALLDALGIDSCVVIGHCAGGLVGYLSTRSTGSPAGRCDSSPGVPSGVEDRAAWERLLPYRHSWARVVINSRTA